MIYSGPPQNTFRKDIDSENVRLGHKLLKDNNVNPEHCIVHAPYIINLASPRAEVYELAIMFLKKELYRVHQLGLKYLVLHPGSGLTLSKEDGLKKIIDGLNKVFEDSDNGTSILIETMSGKGSELGVTLEEIQKIIEGVKHNERIGVCLDTCHLWDSGQNIEDPDQFLEEFEKYINFDRIKAIHLNDSKNVFGARKDRHENIGYGHIGFDILSKWVHNDRLKDIPKILETPYFDIGEKTSPPYKFEIEMFKTKIWNDFRNEKK